jgi:hypothetical protein
LMESQSDQFQFCNNLLAFGGGETEKNLVTNRASVARGTRLIAQWDRGPSHHKRLLGGENGI